MRGLAFHHDTFTALFVLFAFVLVSLVVIVVTKPSKPEAIRVRQRLLWLFMKLIVITGWSLVLLAWG